MNPTVDQLLDLLLEGDPVAWEIARVGDDLVITGVMQNGQHQHLATVPVTLSERDQDPCR